MTFSKINLSELKTPLTLDTEETHVYIARFEDFKNLNNLDNYLNKDEEDNAKSMSTPELRLTKNLSNAFTRLLLAPYLHIDPKSIKIIREDLKKPSLDKDYRHYQFNIAHTKIYFAFAITLNKDIGIDVECYDRKIDLLAIGKRFLHPKEYETLKKAENKTDTFFRFWTQKEAFVKAIGEGLSFGLENFQVDPKSAQVININDPRFKAKDFDTRIFSLPDEHYLCITAKKNLNSIRLFSLAP